jgi:hypothetical protein
MTWFLIIAAWAFCAGYTIERKRRAHSRSRAAFLNQRDPDAQVYMFVTGALFGPLMCPADLGAEAFRRLNPKGDEK